MAFEALLTLQPLWWLPSNLFALIKGFDRCRGSVNFVVGEVTVGGALRTSRSGLKGILTLKLFLALIANWHTSSKDKEGYRSTLLAML